MALENYLHKAWTVVTGALCASKPLSNEADLSLSMQVLQEEGLAEVIEEWFMENVQQHLSSRVSPQFWAHFSQPVEDEKVISHMKAVTEELYLELSSYQECVARLARMLNYIEEDSEKARHLSAEKQARAQESLVLLYKAILFPKANKNFQNAVNQFYHKAFKAFDSSSKSSVDLDDSDLEDDSMSLSCPGCDNPREGCQCEHILHVHSLVNTQLRDLGLLDRISGEAVTALINLRIRHHVSHTCKGNFETKYLETLEEWLEKKVMVWLELLYGHQHNPPSGTLSKPSAISAHKGRLYHFMYDIYSRIRIQQLFNIIIEFPESEPALLDLKSCLEKTSLRSVLVQSLKHALETRLLHPGVNTADILTAYISAIRALRVLDPTGVLLDLVCEPVRRYLRNRDDTVRCIVSSLTEDGNSELSDELIKGQPLILDESYHSDEDPDDWENWQPDPVDADPAKSSSSRRTSDIISMLVNIYGSKELFVNEYRTLLADRILTNFNYATEKEIRYLELLKLRFGEAQLHFCEVMLKDVADSKRINTHIEEQRERDRRDGKVEEEEEGGSPEEKISLNAMILSAQFWPAFREEKVELPQCLQSSMDRYTKSFEMLKGNRTLSWKPHLGLVQVEIELKDKTLNMSVSPVHAAIIWHFQEKGEWTIEELSSEMQMPAHALRRKIAFWQSHGLLKEVSCDQFVLVEEHRGRTHDSMLIEEDETESAMASAQDQKEEELQVIWSYVVGMLTNLESLPLERIHSMLKMFAMQGPGSECTIHELKAFLDKKVKDQKLLHSTGVYRLPKPGS